MKLAKLLKANELAEAMDDFFIMFRHNIRMMRIVLATFVITHLLACAWAAVGLLSASECELGDTQGGSWFCSYEGMNWVKAGVEDRYLTSFYFAMTTISTVGYGDIVPNTAPERLFVIFAMTLGGLFYGLVVANMSSLVNSMDWNTRMYYEKMDTLVSYMKAKGFPSDLGFRVRRYFKHYLREKTSLDEREILHQLSSQLRAEVALHLIDDVVYSIPLFSTLELDELAEVLVIMKPFKISPGEYLTKAGDLGTDMYLVTEGACVMYDDGGSMYRHLGPGAFCGEFAALDLAKVHTVNVQAIKVCSGYLLSKDDLQTAFANSPQVIDMIREEALRIAMLDENVAMTEHQFAGLHVQPGTGGRPASISLDSGHLGAGSELLERMTWKDDDGGAAGAEGGAASPAGKGGGPPHVPAPGVTPIHLMGGLDVGGTATHEGIEKIHRRMTGLQHLFHQIGHEMGEMEKEYRFMQTVLNATTQPRKRKDHSPEREALAGASQPARDVLNSRPL